VSAVEQNSRAWQAGFRAGDIIYAVNRRQVSTLAEFQKAVRGAGRGFTVSLVRGDFNITIVVR
jgi:S1-C subfamily serine protease